MNKSREHYKAIVASLRAKTIQNGATPFEAEAAKTKALELEKKYLFIDREGEKVIQRSFAPVEIIDFHDFIMDLGFKLKILRGVHYEYESIGMLDEGVLLNWFIDHGFRHQPIQFGVICSHDFRKNGRLIRLKGEFGRWTIDFVDVYSKYHDENFCYDIVTQKSNDMTVGSCSVYSY